MHAPVSHGNGGALKVMTEASAGKTVSTEAETGSNPPLSVVPRHVAIIMDGNNRWAKRHNKGRLSGHRAGVEAVRKVVDVCGTCGVEVLTLFAFSSENWKRPPDEVLGLMALFLRALKREVKRLQRHNIRLKVIGELDQFSPAIQQQIRYVEEQTANNRRLTLVIAASYGGQWDITEAARAVAAKVQAGELQVQDITPELLAQNLSTGALPPPDLLIRTSGEHRVSNFLLWQCAYSEFYFTDVLWPDFSQHEFYKALQCYSQRQRRFGLTSEQLEAGT